MSYDDIRGYMDRKLSHGKRETLTENEVRSVVDQWTDNRSEEELNEEVVQKEIRNLAIYESVRGLISIVFV